MRFLRPPGARPEIELADLCSRCGDCVRACPAQCIQLDARDEVGDAAAGGLPYIVARQSPCVICEELACMAVCPTGALRPVGAAGEIAMGLAVIDHNRCLRRPFGDGPRAGGTGAAKGVAGTTPHGRIAAAAADAEDCRLCIHDCPIGEAALGLNDAGRLEVRGGCTGCGVCERVCPTEGPSIVVWPKAANEPASRG
jgi:ferredoxin-type protein NapG